VSRAPGSPGRCFTVKWGWGGAGTHTVATHGTGTVPARPGVFVPVRLPPVSFHSYRCSPLCLFTGTGTGNGRTVFRPPMADAGGEASSLLPASQLRAKHSKLSKRAALLLRRECDALGAKLVARAMRSRRTRDGPLDSAAVWDALLDDPSLRWLVKRLLELEQESGAQPGAPTSLPRPPRDADPSSSWLPPLVWHRAAPPRGDDEPVPLRAAFLTTVYPSAADVPRPLNPS